MIGTLTPRQVRVVVTALAALFAMALAWQRAWVCDDAFISFRYAENLATGHGLVYNVGERVEGYSNFSWTLLCALAIRCGLDPVLFAQVLGVLCYGALVVVTMRVGERLLPDRGGFLPLAAIAVALHQHLQDFASCGLETMGFVLLTTALVGLLAVAERPAQFAVASAIAVLASLTRPDGAMLGAIAGAWTVWVSWRRRSLGPTLAFAAPGLLLFVPFLAWRLLYYGDLLPNTFYAKSAGDPYPGQGWFYLQLFFTGYWVLLPAVVAMPVLLVLGSRLGKAVLLPLFVLPYLGFVVWVGGDFMFARFCLPVVPLLYLGIEILVRRWGGRGRLPWLVAVAVATVCWHEREDLLHEGATVRGVADERAQYPPARVQGLRHVGARLGQALQGAPLRVAFSGTQAMLVYEAKVAYALEAVTGLTDHFLARRELAKRGQPGHEKGIFASPEATNYALQTQRVHLLLVDHPPMTGIYPWLKVDLFGMAATLVRWDPAVMTPLRAAPGVRCVDLPAHLDDYLAHLDEKPPAQVREDFAAFELVYFRWNDDASRRDRFVRWLGKH